MLALLVERFRMSSHSHLTLGPRLRAHRERRGIALAAVAESIKIKQSLLDQLERNDVSRWPPGIYGRALVRQYAKSIGLPEDEITQAFAHLVSAPAQGRDMAPPTREWDGAEGGAELRLMFGGAPAPGHQSIYSRTVAAAVELAVVLMAAALVTLFSGVPLWTANAIVALTWYPARSAFGGHDAWLHLLRLQRLTTSSLWSSTTEISPIATNLMSSGRTGGETGVDSAGDSFIVKADVNADPQSAASIH